MTQEELLNKMELGELVDNFASAGDFGNLEDMLKCFTEDAEIEIFDGKGKEIAHYVGMAEIRKGYKDLLGEYTTLFHLNGQKLFKLNGDKASGKVYCQEFLIHNYKSGIDNGMNQGTVYEDEYEKVNGSWLIKYRKGTVKWVNNQ